MKQTKIHIDLLTILTLTYSNARSTVFVVLLPFSCFLYYVIAIMLVVKLFTHFFSLLNRKFNEDSKNALKTVIFLLQIVL